MNKIPKTIQREVKYSDRHMRSHHIIMKPLVPGKQTYGKTEKWQKTKFQVRSKL